MFGLSVHYRAAISGGIRHHRCASRSVLHRLPSFFPEFTLRCFLGRAAGAFQADDVIGHDAAISIGLQLRLPADHPFLRHAVFHGLEDILHTTAMHPVRIGQIRTNGGLGPGSISTVARCAILREDRLARWPARSDRCSRQRSISSTEFFCVAMNAATSVLACSISWVYSVVLIRHHIHHVHVDQVDHAPADGEVEQPQPPRRKHVVQFADAIVLVVHTGYPSPSQFPPVVSVASSACPSNEGPLPRVHDRFFVLGAGDRLA